MKEALEIEIRAAAVVALMLAALPLAPSADAEEPAAKLDDPQEVHLTEVRQLTFQGENAEAYWAPDSQELILQATFPPYECDQIFRLRPDRPGKLDLVSTGKGRTTCAYFFPSGERILYASTHQADAACPPRPGHSQGYVWPLYDTYEIVTARPDGSDIVALTDNQVYDAEATVCPRDGSILFTSTRHGDLELYRMDADGSNVQRLTDAPGYDGGAFFSADCSRIVWRASRPKEGEALDDYRRLLGDGLVRPSKLELWVADADGSDARQVTYLDAASFAPYFFPSGERILFSTNHGDPKGREFDIWAVDTDGTDLERITYAPGFDGFPMFSPDGQWLAFASNRNQGKPGETDVYVARWIDQPATGDQQARSTEPESAADRFMATATWLSDDARDGRGLGTQGLEQASDWLAERFAAVGVEPGAGDGKYRQTFEIPVGVAIDPATALSIDGEALATASFVVASSSSSGVAAGEVVPVGYGITAPDFDHDDYRGLDVKGKIVAVRRFVPASGGLSAGDASRRYGNLYSKAANAHQRGASGMIVVDMPRSSAGGAATGEASLPSLRLDRRGGVGLPVVLVRRAAGAGLFEGGRRAELVVELNLNKVTAHNVIGRIPAAGRPTASDRLPGALVVGAHYDHLGMGGRGSMVPDTHQPHNGADDNASGTAAVLEIARAVLERRGELRRDLYLVAFAGEEIGLLGSRHFVNQPPSGLEVDELVAMLNLDMVGRLRDNRVATLGVGSATEWPELLPSACDRAGVRCNQGVGAPPSDQAPFYFAGVPVLLFFTGVHEDYHRPSDDVSKLNAAGGAQIAALVTDLALTVAAREAPLTYRQTGR